MPTIKNSQILPYCHFNKIIKGPGTSFQSPALSQKHVRNTCQTAHQYLTKFHFGRTQDSKERSISVTSSLLYYFVTCFLCKNFYMRRHILLIRHFTIVVGADTYARVNKVSCKQAIYLVFVALLESNSWSSEPDLNCYTTTQSAIPVLYNCYTTIKLDKNYQ